MDQFISNTPMMVQENLSVQAFEQLAHLQVDDQFKNLEGGLNLDLV